MIECVMNGNKYNFPKDIITLERRIIDLEKLLAKAADNIGILDGWYCELKERVEILEKNKHDNENL